MTAIEHARQRFSVGTEGHGMAKGNSRRDELSVKDRKFCAEYIRDENGTRAAREAGFAERSAHVVASRLLKKAKIQMEINRLTGRVVARCEASAERVLQEIAHIAFFDPRKLFREDGSPKDVHEMDEATAAGVESFDVAEIFDGAQGVQRHVIGLRTKVQTVSKIKALEMLAKYHKLLTDKVEHSATAMTLEQLICGVGDDSGE